MPRSRAFPVCLLLLAAVGCRGQAPPPANPPPEVTVVTPSRREITDYRFFTGRIEAVERVEVRPRVQGYIQAIHFKEGAEVKKGDLLYEIDPRTFEAAVAQAQAEVRKQETQLQLTTSEAERAARLRTTQAISEEEYSQRVAARKAAQAALEQARAAVESARLQLSFTRIEAPISGRISRTLVTEGNLVGFNDPTLLTTIVSLDPVYVYFEAPERDFLEYQRLIREQGAATATESRVPVSVGLVTEKDYPHQGVIDFRDNRVDPGTGTMLLRGEVPNPDHLLVPGLFVRVRVPVGKPRTRLLVPEEAISTDQRGQYVLVVQEDNTVAYRPVTVGTTSNGQVIVEEGLTGDERVIVRGIQRARPGIKVEPRPPGEEPAEGNAPPGSRPGAAGATPPPNAPAPPPTASPPGAVK